MLRRQKTKAPDPTPSRFDAWTENQVFEVLETGIGHTGEWIHGYRTIPDMQEAYLELLAIDLDQALQAAQSLRLRRLHA